MSDKLTPITRKETFLAKAGGQNVVTPTPITREETFLQDIIDNGGGGGGGSDLPAVTSEDAGKVLTVSDDGKWVAGEGSGSSGGVMVATATQSGAYVTLDKTWKELADAMESGIVPVILYNDGTNKYKETVTYINDMSNYYYVSTSSFSFETETETGYPSYYAD